MSGLSPRAQAIARTFQSAFAALADLAKVSPGEAAILGQHVASHLRSAIPQSLLLDTGPVVRVEPELDK